MTGPSEAVIEQSKSFAQFIQSLRFDGKGPEWTLPEGWVDEGSDSKMRYTTLRIPAAGGLELSVIPLPTGDGSLDAYVLTNINRWRDQLQLGPLSQADLSAPDAIKIEVAGADAWVVQFEGTLSQKGGAPFAGPARQAPQGAVRQPADAAGRAQVPFTSKLPQGWSSVRAGPMQAAAYEVREGRRQATISISSAGGDLAANINRWRSQLQLAPLEGAALESELRRIPVDQSDATYVELVGPEGSSPRETILGVIFEAQGKQWFIKLKGDADLAAREKPRFEEFVKSIRFSKVD
ncbi:MAG TPA: hypothetical protein VKU82_00580 [Planctomycetaceae bacterium]|nr:hypothetical protein [Planctomycetaceae bacterium]